MRWEEQGARGNTRHAVIPRTLSFILYNDEVLLLRGAPGKRLWPGKLNGIGGHIETGETPFAGAGRELMEEAGIAACDLALRGIVHISSSSEPTGIMLFVYVGHVCSRLVSSGAEGSLAWYPLRELPSDDLVEDLPELIPRIMSAAAGQIVYGLYQPDGNGRMAFHFEYSG
ncbi:MAG: NUDIX domain-containing protein [Chloroflexi bacterium]|nr:NUDIX domain-containing protein [Chloroflexota bacterium]